MTTHLEYLLSARRGWLQERDTNRFGLAHRAPERLAQLDEGIRVERRESEEEVR